MFQFIILLVLAICLVRFVVSRVSTLLVVVLVLAAVLDPVGARIFVVQASQWVAMVWDRLMYVLGF
jgi:hypothetical protein